MLDKIGRAAAGTDQHKPKRRGLGAGLLGIDPIPCAAEAVELIDVWVFFDVEFDALVEGHNDRRSG